jgi:hypothetical protein
MENVPNKDLDKLLQAVGDPFQFLDPPLQDGQPVVYAGLRAHDGRGRPDRVCVIGFVAEPPPPLEFHLLRRDPVHGRRQEAALECMF